MQATATDFAQELAEGSPHKLVTLVQKYADELNLNLNAGTSSISTPGSQKRTAAKRSMWQQ